MQLTLPGTETIKAETALNHLQGKRVGLALSAGFFGFFHHVGVLRALEELKIEPAMISGASAGALVGALFASGRSPEEIEKLLLATKRSAVWDAHVPWSQHGFSVLAGDRFRTTLAEHLPMHDFASCRIPLVLSAYNIDTGRISYLDSGSLIEATYASCALPYLFQPMELETGPHWDGGFGEKTPLAPFVERDDIDAVVVSYLTNPLRSNYGRLAKLSDFLPRPEDFLAHVPLDEKIERDKASIKVLREAGKEVYVLAPERVQLGPFSLKKGHQAAAKGQQTAHELLCDTPIEKLGCKLLR